MTVTEITSESHFTQLTTEVSSSTLIAIYFHTPWAEPCIRMNSVFSSLSSVHPKVVFLSVNADEFPEISESFDVSAVPYFVMLQDGTILKELSGADPKELASVISSLAQKSTTGSNGVSESTSTAATDTTAAAPIEEAESESEAEESEEDLNTRLAQLVKAAPVMLFMKGTPAAPQCGFSRQLVAILREHQVRFGFFDILKDDAVRQGLKKFSDWPTFPQLYIQGELQGGLDIVKESIQEDPEYFKNAIASGESN
ncbi:hydroperoxide and superoxide-radical responsive glutathione-dependent oxidoreductase [Nadsonia fulvescens var. elongata DSM 6958]|uniref:Hydroperoxide and superoxide-radical responsive glutathione-dependent oxidoreductase n=1 Tax=Nadsonia fulvescens var. elongata DSM 6958 TaxID=857566 RepID=A0A1E3PJI5_9ASCO|nr:hydroperoxide and superoxide-radical responsive glutathione-dependent oxidoreductase [Nadsonia fulvescens var. elongata DSM 6958]